MFDVSLRGKTKQTDPVLELCRLSNHIREPAFHVALVNAPIKIYGGSHEKNFFDALRQGFLRRQVESGVASGRLDSPNNFVHFVYIFYEKVNR